DAARDADAVESETHSPSPKRPAISCSTACIAPSSSGPSVSTTIFAPWGAASIMTPMMLFAFTRRPLRLTHTPAWNWLATWVSFADARACSPSLLRISTSRCSIGDDERGHAHDAVAPAAHRLGNDGGKGPVAVVENPDQ